MGGGARPSRPGRRRRKLAYSAGYQRIQIGPAQHAAEARKFRIDLASRGVIERVGKGEELHAASLQALALPPRAEIDHDDRGLDRGERFGGP